MIEPNTKGTSGFDRDILEWNIPEEVLAVLLKDRSTGRNLIWATDDYAERGKGVCFVNVFCNSTAAKFALGRTHKSALGGSVDGTMDGTIGWHYGTKDVIKE